MQERALWGAVAIANDYEVKRPTNATLPTWGANAGNELQLKV